MVDLALSLGATPRGNRARAILRLGAEKSRRADAHARAGRDGGASGRDVARRSITARSSSMRWCRIIMRGFQSLASAAGAAARSTSPRRAGFFRATRPRLFPVSNSGMCASIRSPISGGPRRPSWLSAARIGCRSLAGRARGAIRTFGGCRCQAFILTGDARAADPVCHLSPHHARGRDTCGGARRSCLQLPQFLIAPN